MARASCCKVIKRGSSRRIMACGAPATFIWSSEYYGITKAVCTKHGNREVNELGGTLTPIAAD